MKKILIGFVFAFFLNACAQTQEKPMEMQPQPEAMQTEKVEMDAKQEPLQTEPEQQVVIPNEETPSEPQVITTTETTTTETGTTEEASSGCMRKGASCCQGEDCKEFQITCALGTTPDIKNCDENCVLEATCVADKNAEKTEPPFTEGECAFENGQCCQGNFCNTISLSCQEGSDPIVTGCNTTTCMAQGECKTK